MADRKDTPYDPGIVDLLRNGYNAAGQWLVRNVIPAAWFNPGQPLQPVAQEQARGRVWDYPTGQNLRFTPRSAEPVSFAQLRGLADSYDLLRLLIETRKDQICKLAWNIKPRDGSEAGPNAKAIQDFLQFPDRVRPWDSWLRMLIEDMLVTDAATVFPQITRGGQLYSLEVMDGTTITPVIDYYGRIPEPPSPAYQQIIKGLPAVDYTRDELLYHPRNPRPGRVYGMSPVEQVIMTVNIAMRRQITQLYTFTEGNVPDAIIGVPPEWTPEQIRQFQSWWDEILEGNLRQKSHAKFVPGGVNFHEINKGELFGHAEEWLARVVCFAFSVSPQPFVKEQNRATAQTAKEASTEEGLEPTKKWVKNTMDRIIARCFNDPSLEFEWDQEEDIDPSIQANIDDIYIKAGVYSPAYVADRLGIDAKWMPEEPQIIGGSDLEPPIKSKNETEKLEKSKKKRTLETIDPDRKAITDEVEKLAGVLAKALAKAARSAVKAMGKRTRKAEGGEDAITPEEAAQAISALQEFGWAMLIGPSTAALSNAAMAGVDAAAVQLGIADDDRIFDTANTQAVDYARKRGAELVGKRILADGTIIDNPNAEWRIDESTRDMVRELVTKATDEGWSATTFGKAMTDPESPIFGGKRAMMIARTECAFADTQGSVALWRESGMVDRKEWITAHDELVSPDCRANGEAGPIPFENAFPSGRLWTPDHPNCLTGDSRILALSVTATSERRYDGDIVIIRTSSGNELSATPNHPILTDRGWIPVGGLDIGSNVISHRFREGESFVNLEHEDMPPAIHEITESFGNCGEVFAMPVPTSAEDFHGDGEGSKVAIIRANRLLSDAGYSTDREHVEKDVFKLAALQSLGHYRVGVFDLGFNPDLPATDSNMGGADLGIPSVGIHSGPLDTFGSGFVAAVDALIGEDSGNCSPGYFVTVRDGVLRFPVSIGGCNLSEREPANISLRPGNTTEGKLAVQHGWGDPGFIPDNGRAATGEIFIDSVIEIRRTSFSGHVYNIETDEGFYVANGIVTHNCRCHINPILSDSNI